MDTAVNLALADFSNPFTPGSAAIEVGAAEDCDTTSQGTTYVDNSTGGTVIITTCFDGPEGDDGQLASSLTVD